MSENALEAFELAGVEFVAADKALRQHFEGFRLVYNAPAIFEALRRQEEAKIAFFRARVAADPSRSLAAEPPPPSTPR